MQYDIVDGGYLTWIYGARPFARGNWPPQSVRGAFLALDCLDKTFRVQRNPEYKANRIDKRFEDPAMYQQWQRIRELRRDVVEDPRLTCIRVPGLEADDIIALLAWKFGTKERPLQLLAQDKDLLQIKGLIITDNAEVPVTLDRFANRLPKAITREPIKRNQIPLILALMGDKSDNIPRLVATGDLYKVARILSFDRYKAYHVAYSEYGMGFLDNLYQVILPDPHIVGYDKRTLMEIVSAGKWGAGQLQLLNSQLKEEVESWQEKTMVGRKIRG